MQQVPFLDLKAQYAQIAEEVTAALEEVCQGCRFALGPKVEAFEADFADVFEVRGVRRARRGERWAEVAGRSRVVLNYDGLDGARRCTTLECSPPPSELSGGRMRFPLHLPPRPCTPPAPPTRPSPPPTLA